jgi:hypothetical protein
MNLGMGCLTGRKDYSTRTCVCVCVKFHIHTHHIQISQMYMGTIQMLYKCTSVCAFHQILQLGWAPRLQTLDERRRVGLQGCTYGVRRLHSKEDSAGRHVEKVLC